MDIVDTYAWVKVYDDTVSECFLDNAYRAKYSWLLKLRCRGQVKLLKVEPGQRLHISTSEPQFKEVDKFARFLRAHVRGGKVVRVEMPWWERVVALRTLRSGRELVHYVELLPRGVWVVSDVSGKVLYASRFEEFKDRVVKPGTLYQPPPIRGKPPWNVDALVNSLLSGRDLVRGIVSEWGLPGYVAEELLARTGLLADKFKKPAEVGRRVIEEIPLEYGRIVEEATRGKGYLVRGEAGIEFYSPYRPRLFEEVYGREIRELDDFNSAVDAYFTELEARLRADEKKRDLERQLEAWRRRVEELERAIKGYQEELEAISSKLSLVYENYSHLMEVLECARRARSEKAWEHVLECGVSGFDEHRGVIRVRVRDVELELSVRKSLEEQVLELEKQRGELWKKVERALEVLRELEAKSSELERELSLRVYSKPAPKYWFERFRWSITRNNFIVVAGRDASQNELVVKKYLGDEDIFIHADVHGAPATVLLRGQGVPRDEDILDAAVIAACYSKAWKAGYSYVDVYWVKGRQVSKSPPPGEYLQKGAFMVYGERNYLRVPLRLGLGLKPFCDTVYGGYIKVYVGPPDLVAETCISHVILIPGDADPSRVAKEVTSILVKKALEKTGVKFDISEQDVLNALPGPSRVIHYGVGMGTYACEE